MLARREESRGGQPSAQKWLCNAMPIEALIIKFLKEAELRKQKYGSDSYQVIYLKQFITVLFGTEDAEGRETFKTRCETLTTAANAQYRYFVLIIVCHNVHKTVIG